MRIPHFITRLGNFFPLIIDTDGYPIIKIANQDGSFHDMVDPVTFDGNVKGYPGDKIPAIYSQLMEVTSYIFPGAGSYNLYFDPPAAGTIWHIQTINFTYTGTPTGRTFALMLWDGVTELGINVFNSVSTIGYYSVQMNLYLLPTHHIGFRVNPGEAGKTMVIALAGVKMRTA